MDYQPYIDAFTLEHKLRNSSKRTIKSYGDNCLQAFKYIDKSPWDITDNDLKQFIFHLIDKGYEAKTCNQKIYSLKSFYKLLNKGGVKDPARNLPRQKEPIKIPNILGQREVVTLINSLDNLKHRALLMTAYSAGLRLEEVRLLKITDIDSERMVTLVNGKGNKQRITPLYQDTLELLREYYKKYKPTHWLFEGRGGNKPLCRRSLGLTKHLGVICHRIS